MNNMIWKQWIFLWFALIYMNYDQNNSNLRRPEWRLLFHYPMRSVPRINLMLSLIKWGDRIEIVYRKS